MNGLSDRVIFAGKRRVAAERAVTARTTRAADHWSVAGLTAGRWHAHIAVSRIDG